MDSHLFISVIVPVYNARTIISGCIQSLMAQEYPRDRYECIIVDNNSVDDTAQIIKRYPVTYLCETQQGSYAARNAGAHIAKGEILAFTDADCLVQSNWLQEIERNFVNTDADAILGSSGGINGNLWAEFVEREYEKYMKLVLEGSRYLRYLDTRNCAIRAEAFRHIGGFDARLHNSGDSEIGTRLHRAGYKIIYVPAVHIDHINPTSLDKIMVQRRKQGYFTYQIVKSRDHGYVAQYFPKFHRWYYRWLFHHKSVFLTRVISRFVEFGVSVAYVFSRTLLEGLAKLGIRKLYGLYSLTLDFAFFHGKVLALQEDMRNS